MSYRTILSTPYARQRACELIMGAEQGWVATLAEPKRSNDQNAMLWACLTDLSLAEPDGLKFTPEEWKCLVMHACGWDCQFLPGLGDGRPFPVGFRSSQMSRKEMANLITWVLAYMAEKGIQPTKDAA